MELMLVLIDAQANRNNCQNHQQLAHDCQSQTTEPWKEEDLKQYETVLHNIRQVFIAVCLSGVYFIGNIFFPFLTSIHFWVMGESDPIPDDFEQRQSLKIWYQCSECVLYIPLLTEHLPSFVQIGA